MSELTDKKVVLSGVVAGHSRSTAEAALRDAGAQVQAGVGPTTDLLIVGAKPGASKIGKATIHGVEIITWEQACAPAPHSRTVALDSPRRVQGARTVAPMLAKAGDLPTGEGWQFEVKWDGYRGVATVENGCVTIQSRSAKTDYTDQFPSIRDELAGLPNCIIDGELVVLDDDGMSSLEAMGHGEPSYIVFDVLQVQGTDVRGLPLRDRRTLLETLLSDGTAGEHICTSPAFTDGEQLLAWAADRKLEGLVAKRLSSAYREGSRGGDWLKIKHRCEQEFAIIGWKHGEGAMAGAAGSLLLAVRDGIDWKYVGRVGTGLDYSVWQSFTGLPALRHQNDTTGFDLGVAPRAELRGVTWVEPTKCPVVQVRFQRWTEDGRLWHPSLVAVRDDKDAMECRHEELVCA